MKPVQSALHTMLPIAAVIRWIGLSAFAAYVYFSALYGSAFAKIHVNLPIGLPLFVGEMLLVLCLVLTASLYIIESRHDKKAYAWWLLWVGIIVFLVFSSRSSSFGFTLRNAAMLYYSLFAFFVFEFSKVIKGFHGLAYAVISLLCFACWQITPDSYFRYTFIILILMLLAHAPRNWIWYGFAIAAALSVKPHNVFLGARTNLVSSLAAIMFFMWVAVMHLLPFKFIVRFGLIASLVVMVSVLSSYYADRNGIITLLTPDIIVEKYKYFDNYIKKTTYVPMELEVKLFNPHHMRGTSTVQVRPSPVAAMEPQDKVIDSRVETAAVKGTRELTRSGWNSPKISQEQVKAKRVFVQMVPQTHVDQEKLPAVLGQQPVVQKVQPESEQVVVAKEITDEQAKEMIAQGLPPETFGDKYGYRSLEIAYGNILFRIFIWRDMIRELVQEKAWFGVGLGKPQRSHSLEVLTWASSEWLRDGWITPHNLFLHLVYRTGLGGVGLIVLILYFLIRLISRFLTKKDVFGVLAASVLIYWLVAAQVLVVLELPYYAIPFWGLFGLFWRYSTPYLAEPVMKAKHQKGQVPDDRYPLW